MHHVFANIRRVPLWLSLLCALTAAACGSDAGPIVESNDPGFAMNGKQLMFQGQPFTGIRRAELPAVEERHLPGYREGLQHGLATVASLDGTKVYSERRYYAGHPHGEHTGWHRDGKTLRVRQQFVYGKQHGDAWSWHSNGKPAEYRRFDDESNLLVYKRWRRTGQIFMNVVYHEGRTIGMPGSKVCDPIGTANSPES